MVAYRELHRRGKLRERVEVVLSLRMRCSVRTRFVARTGRPSIW